MDGDVGLSLRRSGAGSRNLNVGASNLPKVAHNSEPGVINLNNRIRPAGTDYVALEGVGAIGENALEPQVMFGQRRVGPAFGTGSGRPDYISGRLVSDVAADLRNGVLHPDQFPVEAFYFNGSLVSINTRTLAALSEAGLVPTKINIVEPSRNVLRRLQERPLIPDAALPGSRVPVTPSQTNLTILRTIEIPGSRR